MNTENKEYLEKQIITYLGNKRNLLDFIEDGIKKVKKELNKEKITFVDLFSGTGIVSRLAKQHSTLVIANDLEKYSKITNECYLSNYSDELRKEINVLYEHVINNLKNNKKAGFITEMYSPINEDSITKNDRVFYTRENAMILDTVIDVIKNIDRNHYILAPLLSEASIHVNTSGVFKGFYKNHNGIGQYGGEGNNALSRIKGTISIKPPIFSNFKCDYQVYQEDSNILVKDIEKVDLIYIDPPYNQHPYGSNYFMLNLLCDYKKPDNISRVSGIPNDWNRSAYNKKNEASNSLFDLVQNCNSDFVLLSYSSDGFIKYDDFINNLQKIGKLTVMNKEYNSFRGSRNLKNRDIYVKEYLFLVDKR